MSVVTGNYGTNANYSAYSGKASSAPPSYDEDYLDLPTYEEDSEEVLPEYTAEEGGSAVDSSEKTGDISQEQIDQLVQMLTQMIMQFLQQLGLVPPQDESGQTLGAGEEGGGGGAEGAEEGGGEEDHGCCSCDDEGGEEGGDFEEDGEGGGGNVDASGGYQYQADGGTELTTGANPDIDQWADDVNTASSLTGLDANYIGGRIYAESGGDPNSQSQNSDGTTDYSLMQVGQERWNNDILPTLTEQDKANIKTATGKDASELDMSNPHDNVIGGSFEILKDIEEAGGDRANPMANPDALDAASDAFVGHDDGTDRAYTENVNYFAMALQQGQSLDYSNAPNPNYGE